MGPDTKNINKGSIFHGPYAGRDMYITMFQDSEREFVVTHNANIKPTAYFTGRETELQELRQRIEEGRKSVLVSGMGGIGKTHICRKLFEEYLNKHATDQNSPFQHIGYIEYNGDMGSSLQNCLKFKQQEKPEQNQEAAWKELEFLASNGKLLLFVDNVDKPMREDPGLQQLNTIPGAIVLTSRQASFSDEFEPYRIGFLGIEQCKEIYEKIRFENSGKEIKPEEVPDLEYIIEELVGRHTITVEFLAHLARTKSWTVRRLREELKNKGFQLQFRKNGELINIQKSYEMLYDLSDLTEAEKNILEAFSVFPYIPLAAETCSQWLLADAGVSEDDEILMEIYQKGWLQFDMEQENYSIHPVFAKFIYEKRSPKLEAHKRMIEACQRCLSIPKDGSSLECQKYIPFAESIVEKLDMEKDIEYVSFISSAAHLLYYIAEYQQAEALYKKGLRIREKVLGKEHPNTAASYNNLAGVYENLGEYKQAEVLYKKGLRINEKVLGEEHLDTATSYNNLAHVYASQGEYKQAEELHKKGLRIREKILGEEHPDTAGSYNNLASVYFNQGKYELALFYCFKAYKVCINKLGFEHPYTKIFHQNMEVIYAEWNPESNFEQWLEEKMKEDISPI